MMLLVDLFMCDHTGTCMVVILDVRGVLVKVTQIYWLEYTRTVFPFCLVDS